MSWLPQDVDHIDDFDEDGRYYLYVETSADGPDGIRYDATDNAKPILCMASSVDAIKGVLPPIRNLGDSPVVVSPLALTKPFSRGKRLARRMTRLGSERRPRALASLPRSRWRACSP